MSGKSDTKALLRQAQRQAIQDSVEPSGGLLTPSDEQRKRIAATALVESVLPAGLPRISREPEALQQQAKDVEDSIFGVLIREINSNNIPDIIPKQQLYYILHPSEETARLLVTKFFTLTQAKDLENYYRLLTPLIANFNVNVKIRPAYHQPDPVSTRYAVELFGETINIKLIKRLNRYYSQLISRPDMTDMIEDLRVYDQQQTKLHYDNIARLICIAVPPATDSSASSITRLLSKKKTSPMLYLDYFYDGRAKPPCLISIQAFSSRQAADLACKSISKNVNTVFPIEVEQSKSADGNYYQLRLTGAQINEGLGAYLRERRAQSRRTPPSTPVTTSISRERREMKRSGRTNYMPQPAHVTIVPSQSDIPLRAAELSEVAKAAQEMADNALQQLIKANEELLAAQQKVSELESMPEESPSEKADVTKQNLSEAKLILQYKSNLVSERTIQFETANEIAIAKAKEAHIAVLFETAALARAVADQAKKELEQAQKELLAAQQKVTELESILETGEPLSDVPLSRASSTEEIKAAPEALSRAKSTLQEKIRLVEERAIKIEETEKEATVRAEEFCMATKKPYQTISAIPITPIVVSSLSSGSSSSVSTTMPTSSSASTSTQASSGASDTFYVR